MDFIGSGDSHFGKTVQVVEPPALTRANRYGLAEVDMDEVGYMDAVTGRPTADVFPRARDWTAYIRPRFGDLGGAPIGLVGPDVEAVLNYGTGGASQTAQSCVPPYGVAMHVVSQYVALSALVKNQDGLIGTPRSFELAGNIQPGRPRRTVAREYKFPPGAPLLVDVPIPPFAVDLSVVGSSGGQLTEQCNVQWKWRTALGFGSVEGGPPGGRGCIPGGWVVPPTGADTAVVSLASGAPILQLRLAWGIFS